MPGRLARVLAGSLLALGVALVALAGWSLHGGKTADALATGLPGLVILLLGTGALVSVLRAGRPPLLPGARRVLDERPALFIHAVMAVVFSVFAVLLVHAYAWEPLRALAWEEGRCRVEAARVLEGKEEIRRRGSPTRMVDVYTVDLRYRLEGRQGALGQSRWRWTEPRFYERASADEAARRLLAASPVRCHFNGGRPEEVILDRRYQGGWLPAILLGIVGFAWLLGGWVARGR